MEMLLRSWSSDSTNLRLHSGQTFWGGTDSLSRWEDGYEGGVVHDESDADDSDLDEDEWREAIEAAQVQDSDASSRDSRGRNEYFVAVK